MPEPKTKKTDADVHAFIEEIPDDEQRQDATRLVEIMSRVTGSPPAMWGTTIVGFDSYHYRYAGGREGDMCLLGFSPRKRATTVYVVNGFDEYGPLLERLGKYSSGKACLYLKRLDDVDLTVLEEMLRHSVTSMRASH
jgi:hypothetical protein